jgi:hypothetical protein
MNSSELWKSGHEPLSEVLHNALTRDLCFERNGDGDFFYYIKEGHRIVYTSGRFWDQEDCARDGFYMLKKLHEDDPLRHDDV